MLNPKNTSYLLNFDSKMNFNIKPSKPRFNMFKSKKKKPKGKTNLKDKWK
jgi:hypothetical protein